MVKYKVHLNFKENGKTLNEIIANVLKIELEKHTYITSNILNNKESFKHANYSQSERNTNE